MLAPVLEAPSSELVVTLADVKMHLRVEDGEQDALLTSMIRAAMNHVEMRLGRALLTQTWRQDFRHFDNLRLRPSPVDVDSITVEYRDQDDAVQSLASTVWGAFTDAQGTYLALKYDQSWPDVYERADAISVTFDAGTAAAEVPEDIKIAILMHVEFLFRNRGTHIDSSLTPSGAYDLLLRPYWRPTL